MNPHQVASIIEYGTSIAMAAVVFAFQHKIAAQFSASKKEATLRIVGIGVIVIFLVGTINFANSFIGQKNAHLKDAVGIINAKLPREMPNGLLYERASFEPPNLIVAHFIARFTAGTDEAAAFTAGLPETRKAILASPEIRKQIAEGVVLSYRYYDPSHNLIGELSIKPEDFKP